jgi:hypothetical protein
MMKIVIDIETIPDQSVSAIATIAETLEVKAPSLLKPQLIDALELGGDGKFKSVDELKSMWVSKFGSEAKLIQAEQQWLKTSFDGAYGQICCICVDIDGEQLTFSDVDEYYLLAEFWHSINSKLNGRHGTYIAHNAKFDLPFLYHRSVITKIPPEPSFKPHARHGSVGVFCTMEAWAGFGGKIGLDRLAKALGVAGKTGMSGADVWPAYKNGEHKKIAEYCADDVRITKEIYNRLTFS